MSVPSLARFKRCTKCGCTKPATRDFFHRQATSSDGLRPACKVCRSLDKAAVRAATAAYNAAYRAANRDALREYHRRLYEADPESYKARVRKNRRDAPEMKRSRDRKRKALKRAAEGSHSADEILRMIADQGGLCAYCEVPLDGAYHVDHMVPLIRGGRNDWTNLAVTCPFCNISKHDRTAEEFIEQRRSISSG